MSPEPAPSLTRHSARTVAAVVVVCDRCGKRSKPLDPERVNEWDARHRLVHDDEDRKARMEAAGHVVCCVVEWMDCDDSSGHAACSCGWRSRSAKACWAQDYARQHHIDVEASLA